MRITFSLRHSPATLVLFSMTTIQHFAKLFIRFAHNQCNYSRCPKGVISCRISIRIISSRTLVPFYESVCSLLLIVLALPASAHSPAQVSLTYDSQNQTLKVTTTHTVSNPSSHYVYKIAVQKNGEPILSEEYKSQPRSSSFSYEYPLNASKGDVLKATAYCSIAGSWSAEIAVAEDTKLIVQQAKPITKAGRHRCL
jgi:desulfoferrodoxin (superoxide reductase-like protein)